MHNPFDTLIELKTDEQQVKAVVAEFFSHFTSQKLKKGERILRENQLPPGVFYLKSGAVRSYFISEEGNELTILMSGAGTIFPLRWAIADLPNIYNYQALTDTELLRVSQTSFQQFVKENPIVLEYLNSQLITDFNALAYRMQHLVLGDAYAKVASVILSLSKLFSCPDEKGQMVVCISFTHQQIAEASGVTRETASLEMKRLKEQGLIDYQGKTMKVLDLEALSRAAFL